MPFDLGDYNTVPERIAEAREKYPDGRLQPLNKERPFWIEDVGGRLFVVYVARFLRTPDDPEPGIGCAWEPFPGPNQFTKDSELQNAETAAWGRAMVAALVADTKKGIASAEEIKARQSLDEAKSRPATKAPDQETLLPPTAILAMAADKAGFKQDPGASKEQREDLDKARRDVLECVTGFRSSKDIAAQKDARKAAEDFRKALATFEGIAAKTHSLRYDPAGKAYIQEEPF